MLSLKEKDGICMFPKSYDTRTEIIYMKYKLLSFMETATNATLDGVVEGVPNYMGKFHSGPLFSIPLRVTRVEPSNAHEEYKELLEKTIDVHYEGQALPIFKGDMLRVYCNGYALPETRAPNQVVEPGKIEVIDGDGNPTAEYS